MATKVTRFIEMLAAWFKEKVEASDPSTYFLCLLNAAYTFDYADEWADVSANECNFKGYQRVNLSSLGYTAPTEPTTGKWQTKSLPATFVYDGGSGFGSLTTETAYAWALVEMTGAVPNLLEVKDLAVPFLFEAGTDPLVLAHFFNALNCDE